jgi:voltage-gated potassium channel
MSDSSLRRKNDTDSFRFQLHQIIFEADTPKGKAFDIALLILIVVSVIIVMLDSVPSIRLKTGSVLTVIEWTVTVLFTIEYILRIYSVKQPKKYILSFYGIIDLLSILPTYISLFLVGYKYLIVIRVLRLLRIFRVLKLVHFLGASNYLIISLRGSLYKIGVFLGAVLVLVIIFGSMMYIIEGSESGFTSIPRSIYWAIVTLTTVGYGDIAPITVLGQTLASIIMILGYSIIAVPTGIVTAEITRRKVTQTNTQVCQNCNSTQHDDDAQFCKSCGEILIK